MIYCRPKPIVYVICIMYYLELENYVYPKILVLCIIKNWRVMFTSRYLYYVYSVLENHVDPQDICIKYYLEFENYVYPKTCKSNYRELDLL